MKVENAVIKMRREGVIAVAIVLTLLMIAIAFLFFSHSTDSGKEACRTEKVLAASASENEPLVPSGSEIGESKNGSEDLAAITSDELVVKTEEEPSAIDDSNENVNQMSEAHEKTAATSGNATAKTPAQSKRWVEDTQQVWVEDKAAWTEQVPVYSAKEVSICNICSQDITGNTSTHAKAHMMAGEGSGHHSEVRQVVTGYETINHPAEGHYETRVVGGHWE